MATSLLKKTNRLPLSIRFGAGARWAVDQEYGRREDLEYIEVGTKESEKKSFSSSCHGAGRAMSRHEASRIWRGSALIQDLEKKGILIRSISYKGVAEKAPDTYKDVTEVVDAADHAGLSRKVAYLRPLI